MRKLVHICFGVLKHQQPYQPQTGWFFRLRLIWRDGIYYELAEYFNEMGWM
jgi:hypothetical protein